MSKVGGIDREKPGVFIVLSSLLMEVHVSQSLHKRGRLPAYTESSGDVITRSPVKKELSVLCKVCGADVTIGGRGLCYLQRHIKSGKHTSLLKQVTSQLSIFTAMEAAETFMIRPLQQRFFLLRSWLNMIYILFWLTTSLHSEK